jgi:hypothetical protein
MTTVQLNMNEQRIRRARPKSFDEFIPHLLYDLEKRGVKIPDTSYGPTVRQRVAPGKLA